MIWNQSWIRRDAGARAPRSLRAALRVGLSSTSAGEIQGSGSSCPKVFFVCLLKDHFRVAEIIFDTPLHVGGHLVWGAVDSRCTSPLGLVYFALSQVIKCLTDQCTEPY